MVRLLNNQSHLRCLNNIPIGGEADCLLQVIVNPPLEVFALENGWFNNILSNVLTSKRQYEVTIENFRTCICLGFMSMVASLLGQWRKWVPSKLLIYELQDVMFCGEFEIFIQFPIWSCDEVCHLLDHVIDSKLWFTPRNDIQTFTKKCVNMYYMRQYKWFQFSLWRFGTYHELGFKFIFLCIENMSNTWYNIILLLSLCKQCQTFCSLF